MASDFPELRRPFGGRHSDSVPTYVGTGVGVNNGRSDTVCRDGLINEALATGNLSRTAGDKKTAGDLDLLSGFRISSRLFTSALFN